MFFLEFSGGSDIDILAPRGRASASVGTGPPAFSEAGILGTCLPGLRRRPTPTRCDPIPAAGIPNLAMLHVTLPSDCTQAGCASICALDRWPVSGWACPLDRSQGSVSGEETAFPGRPGAHRCGPHGPALRWCKIPWVGEDPVKVFVREDPAQTRMAPALAWVEGQHLPETSTRQVSFPGFLPPGHFHVSKPDPGPLASAFSLSL